MDENDRKLALQKLEHIVDDLQRAAMQDNAEMGLVIVLIYKLVMVAEILKLVLKDLG